MLAVVGHVARKETRQILRDRRSLLLILVMPILLTFLFGKALETGELRQIPSVILNQDGSPESNVIVTAFSTYDEVQLQGEVATLQEAQDLLAQGKIKAAIVIPQGFMRQIETGEEAQLQLLLDGTDNNSAPIVEGVARRVIQRYNTERAIKGLWARGVRPDRGRRLIQPVFVHREIRYNPGLQYLSYVMPGVIGLTLQLLTVMLMAVTIPRERERGTLDQLMATPITRTELILGKLLPYFGISLLNVATILFVADRWFNVPVLERLPLLLALCALFVLSSLATGLLISTVSRSQFQAVQIAVFYILPVFMLSGAYAPIEAIPDYIRPISSLFPLMYFSRAVRAVTLRGAGLPLVWKDLVILGGFVLILLYWAVLSFRKRVA
ncbi:MAG: ABC transporter permease [candidate division NC10 bacterium]|nr:ABC transporter permease [candidate division NC10 bacterium]MBI2562629.1 ABC transporter permease [candidate division NC10 bacterium]